MRLTFHPRVQQEVNEAVQWYGEQSAGLGGAFFARLTDALNGVSEHPEKHSFWVGSKTLRRAKLKRFPYAVLYEIRPDRVRVLCLRHDKRHPGYGMNT